jgi:hypothetical protein
MENSTFTRSEKETFAVTAAIAAFNRATNNPNSNLSPIYEAIQAANHFGTFGLIAARNHFGINPDWSLPIYKSMGGIYNTY